MSRTRFISLLLLVSVLAMLLVALNPQPMLLELGVLQLQLRQGLVLVIVLAMGLLIGVMLRIAWITELLTERGRLRRALKISEAKVRAATGTQLEK